MPPKIEYKAGQTYSNWTLLEEYVQNKSGQRWLCVCKCEKQRIIDIANLKDLRSKSCLSCSRKENRKDPALVSWKRYIKGYAYDAKRRGYSWELSLEQVKNIATQNCNYCGIAPRYNPLGMNAYLSGIKRQHTKADVTFAETKIIYSNGLDRVDNTKGYTADNVAACCAICNRAKLELSSNEFRQLIIQIYNNWVCKT